MNSCTCATKEDGQVPYSHYPSCPEWKWKDPDSELVEELAKIIFGYNFDILSDFDKKLYRKRAKAAIEFLKDRLPDNNWLRGATQESIDIAKKWIEKSKDLQSQNKKLEEDIKFLKAEQEKPCSTCKMWASLNSELESKVKEQDKELAYRADHIEYWRKKHEKLEYDNYNLRNQIEKAEHDLRFLVCQKGFPYADFAICADMDLKSVVERVEVIKASLSTKEGDK